ncbi:hypothetical protein [Streptomyces microflavus]|uniref:hypothetical protein n=1 Tax=Streptomyces microflavus TaxID=1919 RepID=UPI00364C4421
MKFIPLTFRWHLVTWRGSSRLAVGCIRTHAGPGTPRIIGATLSIGRRTVGLMSVQLYDHGISRHWYRDFGGRPSRYSIGGWRNGHVVPVSTGWMVASAPGEPRIINGISLTIASRTVYLMRLCTPAQQRAHYAYRSLADRLRRKR